MELSKEFKESESKAIDMYEKVMENDHLYFRLFSNGNIKSKSCLSIAESGNKEYFTKAIADVIDLAEKDYPNENVMELILQHVDNAFGTGYLKGGNK